MTVLVFTGFLSGAWLEPGYAEDEAIPPQFGPVQFVVCKAAAGKGRFFTVILPGTGQPEGWGKAIAHLLKCGPSSEGDLTADAADAAPELMAAAPPSERTMPPQFHSVQFVVCKAFLDKDAKDDDRFFTVILPGTGQPEGWGKAIPPELLDCGPF
jgi:hypothetical protein